MPNTYASSFPYAHQAQVLNCTSHPAPARAIIQPKASCKALPEPYHILTCGHYVKTDDGRGCGSNCNVPGRGSILAAFACSVCVRARIQDLETWFEAVQLQQKRQFAAAHPNLSGTDLVLRWKHKRGWEIDAEKHNLLKELTAGKRVCEAAPEHEIIEGLLHLRLS